MKMFNKNDFTLAEGATHVGNSKNKSKFAFTLAEVLVTLGIIGVVAVLTVPNVISSYQKKVYVAQLQKAYNQISNAVALLMVDEEVDNLNDSSLYCDRDQMGDEACFERGGNFLKKYFKVLADCGHDNYSKCFKDEKPVYKRNGSLENGEAFPSGFWGYCVALNSGTIFCANCFNSWPFTVFVDVNGKKGPNTWGRDAFYFDVNYKGEIAESFHYYPNHMNPDLNPLNDPNRCLENNSYNFGCFTKIINDGWKMDY